MKHFDYLQALRLIDDVVSGTDLTTAISRHLDETRSIERELQALSDDELSTVLERVAPTLKTLANSGKPSNRGAISKPKVKVKKPEKEFTATQEPPTSEVPDHLTQSPPTHPSAQVHQRLTKSGQVEIGIRGPNGGTSDGFVYFRTVSKKEQDKIKG